MLAELILCGASAVAFGLIAWWVRAMDRRTRSYWERCLEADERYLANGGDPDWPWFVEAHAEALRELGRG